MRINAAKTKCRELGWSAVSVTITPEGDARHGLTRFYRRLGFVGSGRARDPRPDLTAYLRLAVHEGSVFRSMAR